ncbi:MAG: FAD-dependent oxidoreductase [Clostridia bacterium]|nr:FAD-dependent oxidoreductase [Clostridia bacterium]
MRHDAVIIGGGPAGLAAAAELDRLGVHDVLVIEREKQPGGILRQCIHEGFGLARYGEALSGPEYAQRLIDELTSRGMKVMTDTTVLSLSQDRALTVVSREGIARIEAGAVILAMGCRERTRGALAIPGERPAGVYTAGVAQAYMNLYNRMIGRRAVILGSGDIGMIMARRLTLEGAQVEGVYEIMDTPSGLPRNISQCLDDYGIPLNLSHTITEIHGGARVTGVTVSAVDAQLKPVPGTQRYIPCDTVILSVGLIPENELSLEAGIALDPRTRGALVDEHLQTGCPGVFAAGNVLHVHDLADDASLEAEAAARSAAAYLRGELPCCGVSVVCGAGVRYALPQRVSGGQDVPLALRVSRAMGPCSIVLRQAGREIGRKRVIRALPAEMIHVTLKADQIGGCEEIEVSAE